MSKTGKYHQIYLTDVVWDRLKFFKREGQTWSQLFTEFMDNSEFKPLEFEPGHDEKVYDQLFETFGASYSPSQDQVTSPPTQIEPQDTIEVI